MGCFNPSNTYEAFLHRLTGWATCHQLAEFVFKIDFVPAKKVDRGEVVGHIQHMLCTRDCLGWLQKGLGWHWLDTLLAQMGVETTPFLL